MYSAHKIVKIYNFQTSSILAELGPAQPQLVSFCVTYTAHLGAGCIQLVTAVQTAHTCLATSKLDQDHALNGKPHTPFHIHALL